MARFMNKWLFLCVALIVMGLLVVGCGDNDTITTAPAEGTETPAETTEPPTEGTEAPPAETQPPGETIELKYSEQNAESAWSTPNASVPWLEQIDAATEGQLNIRTFYGETLAKGTDNWEAIKAGVADFGWCFHGYWANMTPLADVIALPFMPAESAEQASEVLWQLYEEFPAMQEEFSDNQILTLWTSSPYYLLTTKKVESFADVKGLKIRAVGGPPTEVMEAMGAVPVSMGMPDTYQALQTGVLDGILQNWEAMYTFRHYEVCKYMTMVPIHLVYFSQAFNKAKWGGLPADIQDGMMSVGGLNGAKLWGKGQFDSAAGAVKDILEEEGKSIEYVEIPEAEVEQARQQFGQPLWDDWVKKMEADGHPEAQEILDRALELLNK